ncbi:MAG: YnfA family protein [Candidatus Paracaedibacteraceae bacterium]|nr:YnfA family protein [Candidatus Paracaedibacteraceae bacterium]
MITAIAYIGAALAEIAGCFSFWAWLKLEKSIGWLLPGIGSLALFAYLLTFIESGQAGRAYAAYGGVYIVTSLCWLWLVEGVKPHLTDWVGAGLCLIGIGVILMGVKGNG